MKKNLLRVIIGFVIISIVISSIVSLNSYHLETCEIDNCHVCAIIKYVQAIFDIIFAIFVYKIAVFLIDCILSKIHKKDAFFVVNSLIFQKVQFNE